MSYGSLEVERMEKQKELWMNAIYEMLWSESLKNMVDYCDQYEMSAKDMEKLVKKNYAQVEKCVEKIHSQVEELANKVMKTEHDECWFCEQDLKGEVEYVDVLLCRMNSDQQEVVHRVCLKCADEHGMLTKEYYDSLKNDGVWK